MTTVLELLFHALLFVVAATADDVIPLSASEDVSLIPMCSGEGNHLLDDNRLPR